MPAFLDTSALVKYFVEETGSDEIKQLIASQTVLWVSELVTVEGVSALAKKVRKKELSEREFSGLLYEFVSLLASGRCGIIPVDDDVRETARRILSTWALSHSLHSLDALQLASALSARESTGSMQFHSADGQLLAAAHGQGFAVNNPGVA